MTKTSLILQKDALKTPKKSLSVIHNNTTQRSVFNSIIGRHSEQNFKTEIDEIHHVLLIDKNIIFCVINNIQCKKINIVKHITSQV